MGVIATTLDPITATPSPHHRDSPLPQKKRKSTKTTDANPADDPTTPADGEEAAKEKKRKSLKKKTAIKVAPFSPQRTTERRLCIA